MENKIEENVELLFEQLFGKFAVMNVTDNGTYGIYDAETAEKIKLKGQEVLKELLEQRLNQKQR